MDVFYQFGKLMNLDPCDEKVQKAAEELHEITGGQKQVVIEMLDDKYWKKAIRVAGGNGCLEFARTEGHAGILSNKIEIGVFHILFSVSFF